MTAWCKPRTKNSLCYGERHFLKTLHNGGCLLQWFLARDIRLLMLNSHWIKCMNSLLEQDFLLLDKGFSSLGCQDHVLPCALALWPSESLILWHSFLPSQLWSSPLSFIKGPLSSSVNQCKVTHTSLYLAGLSSCWISVLLCSTETLSFWIQLCMCQCGHSSLTTGKGLTFYKMSVAASSATSLS